MKKNNLKVKIIFFLILFSGIFGLANYSHAACSWSGNTGTVASPYAASDVNTCVSDASSKTGDVIIQIPDSSATHTGAVTVNMQSGFTNVTNLEIRGQNACILDTTYIATGVPVDSPTACGTTITSLRLVFTGKTSKKFSFDNIRLTGTSPANLIMIDGDSNVAAGGGFNFHHLFFDQTVATNYGLGTVFWDRTSTAYALSDGVFHHNYIHNANTVFVFGLTTADGGNLEWASGMNFGSEKALYLEDNYYNVTAGALSGFFIESDGGTRFVQRHNYLRNANMETHDASVTGYRGGMKFEVYNNTFFYDGQYPVSWPFTPRSASGVFFNNTITESPTDCCLANGHNQAPVQFRISRTDVNNDGSWETCNASCGVPWREAGTPPLCCRAAPTNKICLNTGTHSDWPEGIPHCATDADCDNVNDACVVVDGSGAGGYPCRDQLGVKQETNGTQTGGAQPFLIWNNTVDGTLWAGVPLNFSQTGFVVAGRDYCVPTGAQPWPSSSASEWNSCTAVHNGTFTYTAYTYPHPLQGDADTTPPAAPTGLNVQ